MFLPFNYKTNCPNKQLRYRVSFNGAMTFIEQKKSDTRDNIKLFSDKFNEMTYNI